VRDSADDRASAHQHFSTRRVTGLERVGYLVRGAVAAPEETIRGATQTEISELERRLGRPIPEQLHDFLMICNGARIGPGGFFGQRPADPDIDLPAIGALWPDWKQKGWLPVAGDGCGNYFVMTTDGQVGFVDTMANPDTFEGEPFPDLFTCIESLLEDDQASAN
jgi:hypothetical protein